MKANIEQFLKYYWFSKNILIIFSFTCVFTFKKMQFKLETFAIEKLCKFHISKKKFV